MRKMSGKAINIMCKQILQKTRKIFYIFLLSGLCGLFAACGNIPQAVPDSETEQIYAYSPIFHTVPDPDEVLRESGILAGYENCQVLERARFYRGDCIYRYLVFTDEQASYFKQCLQVYRGQAWEQTVLSGTGWAEGRDVAIASMVGASEEGTFWEIIDFYAADLEQRYLGYFDGNEKKLLMEWPEEIEDAFVCPGQEINFVDNAKGAVYPYDSDGRPCGQIVLDGFLEEGIVNPVTGDMTWYGGSRAGLRLWRNVRKPSSYELLTEVAPYESKAAYDPEGNLYVADAQAVWLLEEQPRKILSFLETGYKLEELYNIYIQDNGNIRCYVSLDGTLRLLELQRKAAGEPTMKQDILLDGTPDDIFLAQLVTRFNLENTKYRILFLEPEQYSRVPVEIATGQGPDLLILSASHAAEYAAKGYLQNLEGIVEDPSLFLDAAMANGRIDGLTYGIPYCCTLDFPIFSEEVVGTRTSWTVEEMMQTIENSGAETLFWYFSDPNALQIVMHYGLYDNENPAYIDWKRGESHLTEAPFARLLQFAKKYGDTGEYEMSEILSLTESGKIAGVAVNMQKPGDLDYAENFFPGGASYVGYPASDGKRGVYTMAQCVYVNQATEQLEGIREFFRFMLSEEAQKLCVADGMCYRLPVRLSTIDDLLRQEQSKAEDPKEYGTGPIYWLEDGLDERQLQIFQELLEEARPYDFYAMELYDLIYEELTPYFQGDRSLEETVTILDSRVQVYLNEKGQR